MSDSFLQRDPGFMSRAIHEAQDPEQWNCWASVPPIFTSASYKLENPGQPHTGYYYTRLGNPTRDILEKTLASLDGAKHGLVFSSGMTALATITTLLSAGDHLVAALDQYGTTTNYFTQVLGRWNVSTTLVDMSDLSKVKAALQPNTRMVFVESPSNPLLKVVDIKGLAEVIHAKDKDIILVVDNTFMTPYFQLPLSLGADISMNSLSKYLNGHADVLMGAATTNSEEIHSRLRPLQNLIGCVPSPFDCYLVSRGLKTLALRMDQHMKSGLRVAEFLQNHPCVEKVIHPGLSSHPQHKLSLSQCYGHSGMVSFYLKGELEDAKKFLSCLKVFTLSGGLGAAESQVELPCMMSQACVPLELRQTLGITDTLVRMSVGLEDIEMLIQDLKQAFNKTHTK